ncbi:MAG: winged helix-turn-helix transcriptional regulator [Gloeobacteraceae cyanobacterium ES-bin-316]|nr:winged helix-turn-helix transcriptional regulator [Ferruginibacter sp.]
MAVKKTNPSYLPLIESWEQYLSTGGMPNVPDFAAWVTGSSGKGKGDNIELEAYFDVQSATHQYAYRSSEAAFILWRLSKFIRFYTRPVLAANGLTSQDEFAILAHVDYMQRCSKKEAIEANIIELSTGVEIIKRLIRHGMLSEKPNKDDKRERLISLTAAGKRTLYAIYQGFTGIQDLMADLSAGEREHLYTILKGLDDFHTKNHLELKDGNKV